MLIITECYIVLPTQLFPVKFGLIQNFSGGRKSSLIIYYKRCPKVC